MSGATADPGGHMQIDIDGKPYPGEQVNLGHRGLSAVAVAIATTGLLAAIAAGVLALSGCGSGAKAAMEQRTSIPEVAASPSGAPRLGKDGLAIEAALPRPEAAASLPEIRGRADEALLVYRFTDHRFMEAYGYDTLVYRFLTSPGGWISGAVVSERGLGGEKDVAAWNFPRAGDTTYLQERQFMRSAATGSGTVPRSASLVTGNGSARLTEGETVRTYLRRDGKALEVHGSEPGDEPGSISGYHVADWAEGSYRYPSRGVAAYRAPLAEAPEGPDMLEATVWSEKDGVFRYRADGIEPICEVYASGLPAVLAGERAIENIAIMETVTGTAKPLRPLFEVAAGLNRR